LDRFSQAMRAMTLLKVQHQTTHSNNNLGSDQDTKTCRKTGTASRITAGKLRDYPAHDRWHEPGKQTSYAIHHPKCTGNVLGLGKILDCAGNCRAGQSPTKVGGN